jgi:hypothetical protein
VTGSILMQGVENVEGAAAAQPGADFQHHLWFLGRIGDGQNQNLAPCSLSCPAMAVSGMAFGPLFSAGRTPE